MGNIKIEIQTSLNNLGITAKEISSQSVMDIVYNLEMKFTEGKKSRWLWENLTNDVCVNNKDAWQWVSEYVADSEVIMFFDQLEEKGGFAFFNGFDIVKVLADTYGFEFYLTNQKLDYLLCFNHHDVLSAVGSAKEWLQKYKKQ